MCCKLEIKPKKCFINLIRKEESNFKLHEYNFPT